MLVDSAPFISINRLFNGSPPPHGYFRLELALGRIIGLMGHSWCNLGTVIIQLKFNHLDIQALSFHPTPFSKRCVLTRLYRLPALPQGFGSIGFSGQHFATNEVLADRRRQTLLSYYSIIKGPIYLQKRLVPLFIQLRRQANSIRPPPPSHISI